MCSPSQTERKYRDHNKPRKTQTEDDDSVETTTNQVRDKLNKNIETITKLILDKTNQDY